jgi:DtxR family Mn-dependent transcriptional regulator
MERDGLVVVSGDRHLELTQLGHDKAMRVMRKHRLAERLLTDVVGLEWEYVHEEACRWEHVMSDRVERRLAQLLDHPHYSPYGNPIPGLSELGEVPTGEDFLAGVVPLPDVVQDARTSGQDVTVVVKRLGEPLQTDVELLARLAAAGILPDRDVVASWDGDRLTARGAAADDALELPDDVARHVFVKAS